MVTSLKFYSCSYGATGVTTKTKIEQFERGHPSPSVKTRKQFERGHPSRSEKLEQNLSEVTPIAP